MHTKKQMAAGSCIALALTLGALPSPASSHREGPNITKNPKVDATDFYMFRKSYEPGHEGMVTLVANYQPLQDPYGGPNYFTLDPDALYEIEIDNNGDGVEDITFQFRFKNSLQDIGLDIGPPGNTKHVSVPLINVGAISAMDSSLLNVKETYTVKAVFGDRRTGVVQTITNSDTGASTFEKPVDNIGEKSIPDYATYAAAHVFPIALPDGSTGRVFVGQRKDPFVVNLGEVFDLVNLNPLGDPAGSADKLADANVTSLILEVPINFLVANDPVIGGWTTASLRQARVINPAPLSSAVNKVTVEGGAWTQVSRLGMPLVNELVIGIKDKDRFNASEPKDDGQFLDYVTHPTLPALLAALFPVTAPTLFPRSDLVQAFLSGIPTLNQPLDGSPSEMLRLNTTTAPTPAANQNNLGVLGADSAGFPNGRRPGDDVVDITLRVAMGKLLSLTDAPSGQLPYTDGAIVDQTFFDATFPYIKNPLPGSPNSSLKLLAKK